jgi:hypothetical protein
MAFSQVEARIGSSAIGGIDTGVPSPANVSNGLTTVIPSGAASLGAIVRAVDPVLGEGEFILLKGVALTAVGNVVVWDNTFATTLAPATANSARPVAVAMTANVNPANFAWYQIGGMAQVLVGATPTTANSAVGIGAAGVIVPSAAGVEIEGARCLTATATGALATVVLDRPAMQGRIT